MWNWNASAISVHFPKVLPRFARSSRARRSSFSFPGFFEKGRFADRSFFCALFLLAAEAKKETGPGGPVSYEGEGIIGDGRCTALFGRPPRWAARQVRMPDRRDAGFLMTCAACRSVPGCKRTGWGVVRHEGRVGRFGQVRPRGGNGRRGVLRCGNRSPLQERACMHVFSAGMRGAGSEKTYATGGPR
jgi:hypothetical protein